jgi:hypothetical protein
MDEAPSIVDEAAPQRRCAPAVNYQAILGCVAVAPHDKLAPGLSFFLAITR